RSRAVPNMQAFLEMLELKLWLGASQNAAVSPPPFLEDAFSERRLEGFREWLWPVAESEELLAEAAHPCGREAGSRRLTGRVQGWRDRMRVALAQIPEDRPVAKETPAAAAPVPEASPTEATPAPETPAAPAPEPAEDISWVLRRENFRLREENRRL